MKALLAMNGKQHVNMHENEADLLTRMLPSGKKQKGFVCKLFYHIFRSNSIDVGADAIWLVDVDSWSNLTEHYGSVEEFVW